MNHKIFSKKWESPGLTCDDVRKFFVCAGQKAGGRTGLHDSKTDISGQSDLKFTRSKRQCKCDVRHTVTESYGAFLRL